MKSVVISVLRSARADVRVLGRDGLVRGSWLVAAILLALGLQTATSFTQFVVLAGDPLPSGFYARQAVGMVVLLLNFPFLVLGANLGGSDFPRATYQNRVVATGRLRVGMARVVVLATACLLTVSIVAGIGSLLDVVRPESDPVGLTTVSLVVVSVSMVAFIWGTGALLAGLLARSALAGLLISWGVLTAEVLGSAIRGISGVLRLMPLHVGMSMLNALTAAPQQEVVNLRPPDLLDPAGAAMAAAVWVVVTPVSYLAVMSRREF